MVLKLLALVCCAHIALGAPVMWNLLSTTSIPPPARWFAGLAFVSGDVYMFGGEGSPANGILGDTWMFSATSTVMWTEVPTSGPAARYGFVSGVIEDRYWIISHGCNNVICFSDTWAFDTTAMSWSLLVNSSAQLAPSGRLTTAGGVYPGQNELWLSMGVNIATVPRKFSDTWVLRVNTSGTQLRAEWEEVAPGGGLNQYDPFLPHARSLHAGAPISSNTFAITGGCAGGGQLGGPCPIADSWTINLSGREWQTYPDCPPGRTRAVLMPVPGFPGNGYLLGGSEAYGPGVFPQQLIQGEVNDSQLFLLTTNHPENNSWVRVNLEGNSPPNLNAPAVAMGNGVVYFFGGRRVDDGSFQNTMWTLSGDGLDQPDLGCSQPQFTYLHLHGTLMYAAWGLFFPLGVLLGRYYRWTWPCWFVFHVLFQCLGVLVTVAGFVIVFLVGSYREPVFPHAIVGIVLTTLMIQQFLSGIFHPCVEKEDGKTSRMEKSTSRKCWEVYHAVSGFLTIAIGLAEVTLGVFLINAPLTVWAVWAGLGGAWLVLFILHECVYISCKVAHRGEKIY